MIDTLNTFLTHLSGGLFHCHFPIHHASGTVATRALITWSFTWHPVLPLSNYQPPHGQRGEADMELISESKSKSGTQGGIRSRLVQDYDGFLHRLYQLRETRKR